MFEKLSLKNFLFFMIFIFQYDQQQVISLASTSYIFRKITNCDILPTYQHYLVLSGMTEPNLCLYECQKNSNCKLVVFKLYACYLIEEDYNYLVNSNMSEVWQKSNLNGM